jgi:multidrug efflux pump subunit AcrB
MWIVRIALQRPYTFIVLAILIFLLGPLAYLGMAKDIFPNINIPVVSVVWQYNGLPPEEMANRITGNYERAVTTTVNDIEHIESQSLNGVAVVKLFFQKSVRIDTAIGQVAAISQTMLRSLPPGTTPPLILSYSATTVPILQLALSGEGLSEKQLFDFGHNFLRTQLATVQGAAIPTPYGGKVRQVQVDIDLQALQAKGLSPMDVVNAINAGNVILPSGTAKIGSIEYDIEMNATPTTVAELNDLPIKTVGGSTIYIHDVAHVRDGNPPQTSLARVNGQRSAIMSIVKYGAASTLDIISKVKAVLPVAAQQLPPQLQIDPLVDQSLFVRAAIDGVVREALIAACLTALMILLFLGSWRSTLIIAVSIPLSALTSIAILWALGETINIMTLGGLALAVGILVDDATVAIESISRHLEMGEPLEPSILEGSRQIAVPAFVSTLCICIVFVPMFFLSGVARFLFVPLAEAVVFAMLASYVLSRTLVPTLAMYLLRHEMHRHQADAASGGGLAGAIRATFEHGFESVRAGYRGVLAGCVRRRGLVTLTTFAIVALSFGLFPFLGEDFFPSVDTGQMKLHVRARTGTRIEETARLCDEIEAAIRAKIPADEVATIVDIIGLPISGTNLSTTNSAPIGPADADILISLKPEHGPTERYMHDLRAELTQKFPGTLFAFLPADIVSQILNFGLPAPIDIQIVGNDYEADRKVAAKILDQVRLVPGAVDVRMQQVFDRPKIELAIDRTRAEQRGFSFREIAGNVLVTLSGSFQTQPTFWLDPKSGVSYAIATQTPEYRVDSLQDLAGIPITTTNGAKPEVLGNLAEVGRRNGLGVVSHHNVQPVVDIYLAAQGRDLGAVAKDVDAIVSAAKADLPRGVQLRIRGQIDTMRSSFTGLQFGLIGAIVLVYLLIVVNFQSWLDPLIVIGALPVAIAGIVWILFITGTTLSVPALTGAIMCMGVATANSILVVSYAKELLVSGKSALEAAVEAGFVRFRPVIMTALAMIIGMIPLALGFGEGGEQNAPLGRAVIGGLCFATFATLFFVPAFFGLLHRPERRAHAPRPAGQPEIATRS